MTEMFGEAWSPMSVPDLAPDDDDDTDLSLQCGILPVILTSVTHILPAYIVTVRVQV